MTTRAGLDAIDGVDEEGRLRIRVRAAAVDGAANEAVMKTVAKAIRVAPSRLTITRGATSRTKQMALDGVHPDELTARWPGLLTRAE